MGGNEENVGSVNEEVENLTEDRNGKVVLEIFEETLDPVIYSDKEEEGYIEENGIETENGSKTDDSETVGSMVYDTLEE